MLYSINKQVLLENVALLEEEMSDTARRGMKLGAVAGTGALAHAGTFGSGIKNAVDGSYDAAKGMVQTAGSKAGAGLSKAGDFYGNTSRVGKIPGEHNDAASTATNPTQHSVETDAQTHSNTSNTSSATDDGDDEHGLGFLGGVGAAALTAGAGYLGYKGATSKAGKAVGHSAMNAAKTAGSKVSNIHTRLGQGVKAFGKGYNYTPRGPRK